MELVTGRTSDMESRLAIEEAARIAGDDANRLALETEGAQLRALIQAQDTSIFINTARMQKQFDDFKNTAVQPIEGAAASTTVEPSGGAAAEGWAVNSSNANRPPLPPPASA
jgi:hypothetical protein